VFDDLSEIKNHWNFIFFFFQRSTRKNSSSTLVEVAWQHLFFSWVKNYWVTQRHLFTMGHGQNMARSLNTMIKKSKMDWIPLWVRNFSRIMSVWKKGNNTFGAGAEEALTSLFAMVAILGQRSNLWNLWLNSRKVTIYADANIQSQHRFAICHILVKRWIMPRNLSWGRKNINIFMH